MHTYATNAKDKEDIPKYLVVGSIAAALLFISLVQNFRLPIPWYIDTPAVASFYGILLFLFDNYLWRWKFGPIHLSSIPDIRGTWVGEIHSSFQKAPIEVVVHIQQTWSKFSFKLHTSSSTSSTIMASFDIDTRKLRYEYQNEGKSYGHTPDHIGAGQLNLLFNSERLEGKYYTSEGSNNTGTLELDLVAREYLDSREAKQRAAKRP